MYISDSLISEALVLLRIMKQNNCYKNTEIESINTYYGINKVTALNLAMQCKWININDEGTYEFTHFGDELLNNFDGAHIRIDMYQNILKNYIIICKPIWAKRIPYGRNEAFRFMSEEEQICFKKAELMKTPVTQDIVEWWDAITKTERQTIEDLKNDVGRTGEELTIKYENERTKSEPIWESIDSNLSGYDILSQVSESDNHQILIEVKSSIQNIENADFYLSRNEWDLAFADYNKNRYYFYLWLLGRINKLAIISTLEMQKNIPSDNGLGEWSEVKIPFCAFANKFEIVATV